MEDGEVRRRLAAILAADVAGYSRLMGDDERATIACLRDYRSVFQATIAAHGGRVVDMAGDSVLAVFDSAAGAVEAAVETQSALAERNEALPEPRRMRFRIGVNLGDIEEADDGTVYGDGVNVAARLEAMANAGGINVSGSVFDSVRSRLDLPFDFLGEHEVKNIADPVRAYRVGRHGGPARALSPFRRRLAAGVAALAGLVIVLGIWWLSSRDAPPEVVAADGTPTDDPVLAMPTGPSIAVLPFENLSGDESQDYFAAGITEELITALSRFDLLVLARQTTEQFKGTTLDVREIGKHLNVAYVLEGSVRKDTEKVRVSAQLLDAESGATIWAEKYDRALTGASVLAVQDEVTSHVVGAIADEHGQISRDVLAGSGSKAPESYDSYDCVIRAPEFMAELSAEKHSFLRNCLERVVEREADYASAWAWLSQLYVNEINAGLNRLPNSLERAINAGQRALALDPGNQIAHFSLAWAYYLRHDLENFRQAAKQAIVANPNNAFVLSDISNVFAWIGESSRAMALFEKAIRLNPNHPGIYYFTPFHVYNSAGEFAKAAAAAEKLNVPEFFWMHAKRATAYGNLGDEKNARKAIQDLLKLYPDFASNARDELEFLYWADPAYIDQYMTGLEKAGLFDQPNAAARPVIAVLPFDNLSGDPEQEYFADGITEDIITRMTQFQELGVIARSSTFQYKSGSIDVRTVGAELGADYVVEGSVRGVGATIRIAAQLIDASDGTHLWAEAFDRPRSADSIFDIQDEISRQVASLVGDRYGMVMQTEMRGLDSVRTDRLSSYECVLWAAHYALNLTEDNYTRARACLDRVTVEDPDYAVAWAWRAELYIDGLAIWADPDIDSFDYAVDFANRAVALSPNLQYAHWTLAYAYFAKRDITRFLTEAELAVTLNPNNAAIIGPLGALIGYGGEWNHGVALINQAIELNPNFPAWINGVLVADHIRKGDYAAALRSAQDYTKRMPDYFWAHANHATTLGLMGRTEDAQAHANRVRVLNPEFEANAVAEFEKWVSDEAVTATMIEGLRAAGMSIPDESLAAH